MHLEDANPFTLCTTWNSTPVSITGWAVAATSIHERLSRLQLSGIWRSHGRAHNRRHASLQTAHNRARDGLTLAWENTCRGKNTARYSLYHFNTPSPKYVRVARNQTAAAWSLVTTLRAVKGGAR
jgi:hypothetical protein